MNKKKIASKVLQAGGWRVARKFARAVPGLSTTIAIGFLGYDIKKKGVVKGVINSGLDAIPVVGTVKNVTEMVTGDFLPDKKSEIDKKIEENNQIENKIEKS